MNALPQCEHLVSAVISDELGVAAGVGEGFGFGAGIVEGTEGEGAVVSTGVGGDATGLLRFLSTGCLILETLRFGVEVACVGD